MYQIATRQPNPRKRTKAPKMTRHIHIKSSQLKPPTKGSIAKHLHNISTEEKDNDKRHCFFYNIGK